MCFPTSNRIRHWPGAASCTIMALLTLAPPLLLLLLPPPPATVAVAFWAPQFTRPFACPPARAARVVRLPACLPACLSLPCRALPACCLPTPPPARAVSLLLLQPVLVAAAIVIVYQADRNCR